MSQVCLQPNIGGEFLQIKAGSQDQPHLDVDKKPKLQLFKYSQSNIACSQMMRGQTPVSLLLSPAIFNAASEKMLLLHQKQLIRGSIRCWELSKTSLTSTAITAEGLDPSTNVLLEEVEAVLRLLSKRVKQQILCQNQQMQHTRYFLNPWSHLCSSSCPLLILPCSCLLLKLHLQSQGLHQPAPKASILMARKEKRSFLKWHVYQRHIRVSILPLLTSPSHFRGMSHRRTCCSVGRAILIPGLGYHIPPNSLSGSADALKQISHLWKHHCP